MIQNLTGRGRGFDKWQTLHKRAWSISTRKICGNWNFSKNGISQFFDQRQFCKINSELKKGPFVPDFICSESPIVYAKIYPVNGLEIVRAQRDIWLRLCKLENVTLKEAKNAENLIFRPKKAIFWHFQPLSKFHFVACTTLNMTHRGIARIFLKCLFLRNS